ncbi:MAG TPA: hypothetical protein VMS56_08680 [Thermoanaerobaculia bacterium]|nr:hypothetical protein [Thermoanaerobaculia bacterium]
MDAQSPTELDARTFIERSERGELPPEFVLAAARGFLPLPQEELVPILAYLAVYDDAEVSQAAQEALGEMPPRVIASFARNQETEPARLDMLARATDDPVVHESILRNRSTPDETFEALAGKVGGHLQEIIVINHERLIRSPQVLEALAANPQLTPDVRRRITEVREEFFDKKRIEQVKIGEGEYGLTPEEQETFADLLAEAAAADAEGGEPFRGELPPGVDDPEMGSAWVKIQQMTIAERVQCALKGGRTERSILVKDRNRLVCGAVIKSPRITESEIEAYTTLRNVEDEVLRLIGGRREWMQKYPIMFTLVKNPKAPIGVVLPLINRLTLRDLKTLSSDKGVSDSVRQSARRLYNTRKKS